MKKLLIGLLLLSSCEFDQDKSIHSKGLVAGFFEVKSQTGSLTTKISIQDTSGKVMFIPLSKCTDCLVNDSIRIIYHDNSLITDAGDKYEVDSCVKFYNATWKAEKVEKKLYFYDDSGRIVKIIDTIFVKR
jgi:hypothetical protein